MKKLLAIALLFVAAGLFADNPGKEFVGKWVQVGHSLTVTIEAGKAGYILRLNDTMGKAIETAYFSNGVLIVSTSSGQQVAAISSDGLLVFDGSEYKSSTD